MKWLKERMILLTVAGSRAYGTNVEGSDVDYKGVCIPPEEYYFGLETFAEYANTDGKNWSDAKDLSISHVNKFVANAMKGVPNDIEILFVRPEDIAYKNKYGEELISHRHDFLSKAIKHKFGGYTHSQIQKLLVKNSNGTGRVDLIERFGFDTKFAMHAVRLLTSGIEILKTGDFATYRGNRDFLLDIRNGWFTLEQIILIINDLDEELTSAYENCTCLPHSPDYHKINSWLINLNKRALSKEW
jgi:predicted nucleotidyltransferase